MLDDIDYTTGSKCYQGNGNGYHANHNGYDKLDGDYALFYKVAKSYTHKVKREDNEDFLHDLLLDMAKVKLNYAAKGKELSEYGLIRVARYALADYWRQWYHRNQNTDCWRCSKAQRQKCKQDNSYRSNCPKAIQFESLDKLIEDGNGDSTPLYELIADDNAIDIVAMLDNRYTLKRYPSQAVKIAYKRYAGYALNDRERTYLYRFQKKFSKTLF